MKADRRRRRRKPAGGWAVYLICCRDGSLYTGIALDVARRLAEHRRQASRGAKYLAGRGPLRLVFERAVGSRSRALRIEHRIKLLPKTMKERLVRRGDLSLVMRDRVTSASLR